MDTITVTVEEDGTLTIPGSLVGAVPGQRVLATRDAQGGITIQVIPSEQFEEWIADLASKRQCRGSGRWKKVKKAAHEKQWGWETPKPSPNASARDDSEAVLGDSDIHWLDVDL